MRALKRNKREFHLFFAAMLCTVVIPFRSFADDKKISNPPPKSVSAKPDSPAPLTERERWMLDRMEQLEKRVAELESKSNSPATPATEISPPLPTSPNLSTSSLPTGATSVAPAAEAGANVVSTDKTVALGTAQATEKGKSGAAQAARAERRTHGWHCASQSASAELYRFRRR